MTLLKISVFLLNPEDIAVTPMAQLSCTGCSSFLNNYACPFYTVHASVFRDVLKRVRQCLLFVAWLDLASRVNTLAETITNVKQVFTLACLQLESYAHRALNKHISRILSLLEHSISMWFHPGGGCRRCKSCAATCAEPCRCPVFREPPAPEAVGVDIYATLARHGIYYEHPPRRVVVKTALFLLKTGITKAELEKLGLSVEENLESIPKLRPEVEREVRKLEEADRAELTQILKRASQVEIEVRPVPCRATSCPLRGSLKCHVIRKYFEKLAGAVARLLIVDSSADPTWLRQSYMRHISPLCSIISSSVRALRRGQRHVYYTLCRYAIGLETSGTALVVGIDHL